MMIQVIRENEQIKQRMFSVEFVIDEYIAYNKDTNKYKKYLEEKHGRRDKINDKDGIGKSVSDK